MPEPDPHSFRTTDGHQTTTIRGSCWREMSAPEGVRLRLLTEWNRASDLAREVSIIVPRRAHVGHQRRGEERIHTQRLHLEHLIRLLHDFPQPDRFLQLGLPLQPCLGSLGVQGVQASQSAVVVNRTRVYRTSVVNGLGTRTRTLRVAPRARSLGFFLIATTTEW